MQAVLDLLELRPGDLLALVPWPIPWTSEPHLCISHRCCVAHQLGKSDVLESSGLSECQKKFS